MHTVCVCVSVTFHFKQLVLTCCINKFNIYVDQFPYFFSPCIASVVTICQVCTFDYVKYSVVTSDDMIIMLTIKSVRNNVLMCCCVAFVSISALV